MGTCKNTVDTYYYSAITDISKETWAQLGCTENIYFSPNYLEALEKHHPEILFSYVVLVDEARQAIALATIKVIDFSTDAIVNFSRNGVEKLRCFGRRLFFSKAKPLKILVCGNSFVSGEHGIFIKENQDEKVVIRKLAKAIHHFVNTNETLKKELNLFVLKDFIKQSLTISNELHDYRYYSFNVEPNMRFKVNKDWQNFEDYLAEMRTKFRVKAKRAMTQSAVLKVVDVTSENIADQLPKMTSLYKKVATKADFNLGEFNLATYKSLKEKLGDNYILKTYWLEDRIVGFLSGVINQKNLDAHFVGIDYKRNREYAIYQRMLYDYIQIAIQQKLDYINFGRTASEIKSSVGAYPEDLTIYLRHKKSIKNRMLKPFLQNIQPSPFKQQFPFKTEIPKKKK